MWVVINYWYLFVLGFWWYMRHHGPILVTYKLMDAGAQRPIRAYHKAACYDMFAAEDITVPPNQWREVNTGVAFASWPHIYIKWLGVTFTPFGNVAIKMHTRSGLARKRGVRNHLGIIDNDYRAAITCVVFNHNQEIPVRIHKGDRVGQIEIYRVVPTWLIRVNKLSNSLRGTSGFGSTGK